MLHSTPGSSGLVEIDLHADLQRTLVQTSLHFLVSFLSV